MRSGFFNSEITGYDENNMPIFDRAETAEFFAKFFHAFLTNGIYPNPSTNFQVVSRNGGMMTAVNPGLCLIEGYFGWEDEVRTLIHEPANSNFDRIDRIVLRLDLVTREIDLYVLTGTASASPVAPSLTRPAEGEGGDIYELGLADVFILKNSTGISQTQITDTRLNTNLCGLVTQFVRTIDTTAYFEQLNAMLSKYSMTFQDWFASVKAILDENVAGNLLNLINTVNYQYEVEIPKSGWRLNSNGMYEQTIDNSNAIEYSKRPFWALLDKGTTAAAIEAEEKAFACLTRMNFGNGKIQLICKRTAPEISFTVLVTPAGIELSNNSSSLSGILSYEDLLDKPQINSVELIGNKEWNELGIELVTESELDELLNPTVEVQDE